VDSVLKLMTEEKVGQLNQYNGFWEITDLQRGTGGKKYDDLKKGLVGSMLNVRGVKDVIQKLPLKKQD
jgi:beta-glucosidase